MKGQWKYAGMLALSFIVLFFLPQELNVISYTIFGISIFLFMVGYFNLEGTILAFSAAVGYTTAHVLFVLLGLIVMMIGPLHLMAGESGKGMILSFLFMMEGILLITTAGAAILNLKTERILSVVLRIFAAGMLAAAVMNFLSGSIITGFFMTLDGIVLWIAGLVGTFRERVEGVTLPISELYEQCRNEPSPMGEPRLDKVGRHRECIVFGPDVSGLLVYAYYQNKKFYVALGENEHKERETEAADVLETYTEIFKKHAL